ncbi:MAG: peptide MFS transporter [Crocinitomicaceae bacterium]|nr:peptide MFS transporter [Crocinitomicaceae bacterium]
MQVQSNSDKFFQSKVLGHPAGLFVLFFTEMWERFSFYGMRVLLINFLTMAIIGTNPGWEWDIGVASTLFATYAGLLYLTPILGGIIADKFLGYRMSVAVGAIVMTLGHACMALDTEITLYLGLALLVIGTGFFKPTITSIISEMYKDLPQKKDGAYTIFYMGVNAGAFFGMMLCGYLAEKVGWSWGFGLAGVFMLLGLIQFWFAKPLFGTIGDKPDKNKPVAHVVETSAPEKLDQTGNVSQENTRRNPFTPLDSVLSAISALFGLTFLLDGPFRINDVPLIPEFLTLNFGETIIPAKVTFILVGLFIFLFLVFSRISRYERITRNRMIAVIIFACFTIFFWMSFEQGASSLVYFARDYTDRFLEGGAATAFLIIDLLLTFVPLIIITWVLVRLWIETRKEILMSNVTLIFCFILIWGLGIWKTNHDLGTKSYEVTYTGYKSDTEVNEDGSPVFLPVTEGMNTEGLLTTTRTGTLPVNEELKPGQDVLVASETGTLRLVDAEKEKMIREQLADNPGKASTIINAQVVNIKEQALIIMAIGFGVLAYGSNGLVQGSGDASRVSLMWLVFAYLFHTIGELCISPVGLSYVSKLVPGRMIAFMFGMWYLAIAIGNYSAASLGGMIEEIQSEYSMSVFFLIFTIIPAGAGLIIILLNPMIKKLMHGVR